MLQGWIVIAVALGYIGLLFLVASYGDRTRRFGREGRWRFIYPLSLAIYCTSWTFFGSVGLASRTGFDFLTIYVGPMLMIGLCPPPMPFLLRLANGTNTTSTAHPIPPPAPNAHSTSPPAPRGPARRPPPSDAGHL